MIYTLRCHVMKHEGHGCFTSFMICCTNLIKTYQPISVYNLFITNVTSIVLLCFIVLIRPVSSQLLLRFSGIVAVDSAAETNIFH